jgi:hypothetical protein
MTLVALVVMADRFETEAFMRDHGVAAQAVVINKGETDRPTKEPMRSSYIDYRFWPRSADGGPAAASVTGYDVVSRIQYTDTNIGQIVSIRYNPQRLSQSKLYFGPPPTDLQMIVKDGLLLGLWVIVFGGICALIAALAWPEAVRKGAGFRSPRPTGLSS